MEFFGMTQATNGDWNSPGLKVIRQWRWRDENFNFTTLDQNGGNIFEAYVVRISCRRFYLIRATEIYITIIPCARVGYNHFISNKGKWINCSSKFSNRFLPPIFISTILQSVRKENLAYYFPYDVKLRLLAHSRRFLANQRARNAIVGAESLLIFNSSPSAIINLRTRLW